MRRAFYQVRAFHNAFGLPARDVPQLPNSKERARRICLLREEFEETIVAENANDLPGIADGLADIIYIALGTACTYGIPLDVVWERVHEANMRKLGPDNRPIFRGDGKVLKPADWSPPDVVGALISAGWAPPRKDEE